jgi:diguanylate cyclase (GGDEF)-like protein
LKKRFKLKYLIAAAVNVATVAAVLFAEAVNASSIEVSARRAFEKSYSEVAAQSIGYVRKEMDIYMKQAETDAAALSGHQSMSEDEKLSTMKRLTADGAFYDLILLDANGNSLSGLRGSGVAFPESVFMRAMDGFTDISGKSRIYSGSVEYNAFSAPIYTNGEITGVLAGIVPTERLTLILTSVIFGERTDSFAVNPEGKIYMISAYYENSAFYGENIFDSFVMEEDDFFSVKNDFVTSAPVGMHKAEIGGAVRVVSYNALGIGDLIIVRIVPESVITDAISPITVRLAVFNTGFLIAAVALSVAFTVYYFRNAAVVSYYADEKEKLTSTDALTGCYAMSKFLEEAKGILRLDDYYLKNYVVSLDINKFRSINDMLGYDRGNQILKQMAEIITRDTGKNDIVTRVNDVFYFVVSCENDSRLIKTIDSVIADAEYVAPDQNLVLSIGIYGIDDRKLSVQLAMDRADIARRMVKNVSESAYAFFDDKVLTKIREEKEIEDIMDDALARDEFIPYLQPKYALRVESDMVLDADGNLGFIDFNAPGGANTAVMGAEALVRWKRNGQLVPPYKFIPLFESNGFITKLDKYIFEETCKRQKQWINRGLPIKVISVNASRVNLFKPYYIQELSDICQKYSVPTRYFEIEITETIAGDDLDILKEKIFEIKKLGFHASIDDFGSGYSSLNMLKDLPVDILKIDRGFLAEDMLKNERAYKVLEHVISLAVSLNIKTVCEGLETEGQVEILRDLGCDMAQGYYFAKPMPLDEYERLVYGKGDFNI